MAMHGEVIKITRERSCEVRTGNDILVVFPEPARHTLHIGDLLCFDNLSLGVPVRVDNLTRGGSFEIQVPPHDIHDLRCPLSTAAHEHRVPNA